MSEQDVAMVEETPPLDHVEQPARSRGGAYKLCMECGQNVLRFQYRAGSSICQRCEARAQGTLLLEQSEESAPDVVPGPPEPVLAVIQGSRDAFEFVQSVCGGRSTEAVTLDRIQAYIAELHEERVQMIGRVTRGRPVQGELRAEDVPLEVAAQTLWLACDPILQEALSAAMELLGLSLNQVILGNLAFSRQELLNQDQSLVPQASLAVQYGQGRGLLTQGNAGRTGLPGGRLVDANGLLVKDCLCCGREFHPPRDRPNPYYCDEGCGTFADQLRIWATNTVLNELRYPGQTDTAPLPDPRGYWPVDRCQDSLLQHALQFRESQLQVLMQQARDQQSKMRGL